MQTSSSQARSGAAVRFEHVTKRYRLGAGRVSPREVISLLLPGAEKRLALAGAGPQALFALNDVSFELGAGRALGLIGPNGAGKTTSLKLMAQISRPHSGRVEVNGRVSSLIELGAGFHPELTGRENIFLNAAILGMPQREAARLFDRIVSFAALERFIDTPVKHYSSGMYVRLGFSVAAHVDPDVLLVDEVLAVGDAQFRQQCAQRIAELRSQGTTIVFVSHIMPLVRSVCDEGIFLAEGSIQAHGDILEVIRTYENYLQRRQMDRPLVQANQSDPAGATTAAIRRVDVEALSPDRHPELELRYDGAAEVRVHYAVQAPISDPGLVVRIMGADGVVACMIRSRDYGFVLDDLVGEGIIRLRIDPLQLASGAYSVEARLLGTLEGSPLAVGYSTWFQVAGLSTGHMRMGGVFVPHIAAMQVEPVLPVIPLADPVSGEVGA